MNYGWGRDKACFVSAPTDNSAPALRAQNKNHSIMGVTKTDIYSDEQNKLADICKAIGHPARVAILQQLLSADCCICRDFTDEIPLSQPTVSKHLKALKEVGLISGTIEGTSVSYCINALRWREVQSMINQMFNTFQDGEGGCC
jgi:DNA-binding transcriptional ArsR family regulator